MERSLFNNTRVTDRDRPDCLLIEAGVVFTVSSFSHCFHTGLSINNNVKSSKVKSIDAMHELKKRAIEMKEAVLTGNIGQIGPILHDSWQNKKAMAGGISNSEIDSMYDAAMSMGATGGKISGAGGGGYIFFYCPANTRFAVGKELSKFGGNIQPYNFTEAGLTTWSI